MWQYLSVWKVSASKVLPAEGIKKFDSPDVFTFFFTLEFTEWIFDSLL